MTVDASGNPVGWDDYYPYGMTMTGRSLTPSGEDSRYKFTGKERDAQTGLDYFGARYYDSWRGQWLQVDPLADKYPGWSPYNYVLENPMRLVDSTGKAPGGNPDPTTFVTQYVQSEFNSLWNTGSNIAYNFTYNTLPPILDRTALLTALPLPPVSTAAALTSDGLMVEKDLIEKGTVTNKSIVSLTLDISTGGADRAVAAGASFIQFVVDKASKLEKTKTDDHEQQNRDETTIQSLEKIKKIQMPIQTYKGKND